MKNISKKILILALSLVVIISSYPVFGTTSQGAKVKFVTGEWAPYTSEKLKNYGAYTELVTEICKAAGIDYEIKFYPWKRAEDLVLKGEAFATFPYAITEERKKDFDFSDVTNHSVNLFVYYDLNSKTKKDIKYDTLKDLSSYTFAIPRGNYMEAELKKMESSIALLKP